MSAKRAHNESDDEDLEKELLSLSKKKPSLQESEDEDSSDSSTDDDDAEWDVKSDGNKKSKKKKTNTNLVKKAATESNSESSSEEEGEIKNDNANEKDSQSDENSSSSSDDSSDEELPAFDDGLDDDLMGDENDRKKLEQMTEKDREEELFNRMEKREALKTRREIQLKLLKEKKEQKAKKDKKDKSSSKKDSSGKCTMYSETISSRKESRAKTIDNIKKSAFDEIKQKRQEKREKMNDLIKKKEPLTTKDVYSDDDEDENKENKNSSSDDSSSSDNEVEDEEFIHIETIQQLELIRLSRHKLEQWVHLPFFNEIVVGCFVRMGIGNHLGKAIYRVVEITAVTETPKIYQFGTSKTNKGLKVRHALQERVFRMEYVSNHQFSETEFQKWKDEMKMVELPLPTIKHIKVKAKEITDSKNYRLKDNDIEAIVQEKNKFRKNPHNYAMKKNDLLIAKTVAEQASDDSKIETIMKELEELEERAKMLDKQRSGNLENVSSINERNRKKNIYDAEKAVLEESKNKADKADDPFTRRRTLPKMITKGLLDEQREEKDNQLSALEKSANSTDIEMVLCSTTKNLACNVSGDSDMFDVHDFDINIDVAPLQSPTLPVTPKPAMLQSNNNNSRRSLNLDEYKKRKGLM